MLAKAYLDLMKKQQQELTDFPMAYAFSDEQLTEALEKLGATKDECCTYLGIGDVLKKSDVPALKALMKKHHDELRELIKDKDIAYEAFLYEMNNHEYCINWDGDGDVLGCFGLEYEDLNKLGLRDVYILARREHMRIAHEEWEII